MVTAGYIGRGALYAGIGIGGGLFTDYVATHLMQGAVPYFNDIVNGAGAIALGMGVVGGVISGVYEAFFSPSAQNLHATPANPNIPNAGPRINIINRGGRNTFRF